MMGMGSIVEGTDAKGVEGALAILSVVGNDNKYTQRLHELQTLVEQANQRLTDVKEYADGGDKSFAEARAALADAKKLTEEAVATKLAADAAVAASQADIAAREKALIDAQTQLEHNTGAAKLALDMTAAQNEAQLSNKQQNFDVYVQATQRNLDIRQKDLDEREGILVTREDALKAAHQNNKELAAQLAQKQADLDTRLSKLRDIVS